MPTFTWRAYRADMSTSTYDGAAGLALSAAVIHKECGEFPPPAVGGDGNLQRQGAAACRTPPFRIFLSGPARLDVPMPSAGDESFAPRPRTLVRRPKGVLAKDTPNDQLARACKVGRIPVVTNSRDMPRFTERQIQVVALIAQGCSNVEIADSLGVSPRTAKAHCDVLRSKLRVSKRRQIPLAFHSVTGRDPLSLNRFGAGA